MILFPSFDRVRFSCAAYRLNRTTTSNTSLAFSFLTENGVHPGKRSQSITTTSKIMSANGRRSGNTAPCVSFPS